MKCRATDSGCVEAIRGARILLMLCIMKLGMLPAARDPAAPSADEVQAVERKLAEYQTVFNTH